MFCSVLYYEFIRPEGHLGMHIGDSVLLINIILRLNNT